MLLTLPLPVPQTRDELRRPLYRKTWTRAALIAALGESPIRALDVGAGRHPLRLRPRDNVIAIDFDATSRPTIASDFTQEWPFGDREFDLVYLSHIVEHLYPRDRDAVIRAVYKSTCPGGLVFIRVPHRSSIQATGWEHHTLYGLNGVTSLCHGYNPNLPMFRAVSVGVARSVNFDRRRRVVDRLMEHLLNRSFRLTDQLLGMLIGGIAEVQFLLQRLPADVEEALREDTDTATVN